MSNYPKLNFNTYQDQNETGGQFSWSNSRSKVFEKFYNASEISEPEAAISELHKIIDDDPEFINAYNSIGFWELTLRNYGIAIHYFMNAFKIGDKVMPKNFNGKIIWGIQENRPFLRSMQGLGLSFLYMHEWDEASKIFKKMLAYNPNDNQGVRALAIQGFIAQGKFEDVLKICKLYPDDAMPDTVYGALLANYRLDRIKNAEQVLKTAIEYSSNVAKELVKKKHTRIEGDLPAKITVGGEDEAYEYWQRMGHFWTDPKILKFIADGQRKWGKQS